MTSYELIGSFAFIVVFITTLVAWIVTYRTQRKTQQEIAKLAEQIHDMMGDTYEANISKYLDSDKSLSIEEMKELALWYSCAKRWFLKGKGTAVDWENKHLREEIASPIRQKLAIATTELDIKNAFDLRKAKPPSDDEI